MSESKLSQAQIDLCVRVSKLKLTGVNPITPCQKEVEQEYIKAMAKLHGLTPKGMELRMKQFVNEVIKQNLIGDVWILPGLAYVYSSRYKVNIEGTFCKRQWQSVVNKLFCRIPDPHTGYKYVPDHKWGLFIEQESINLWFQYMDKLLNAKEEVKKGLTLRQVIHMGGGIPESECSISNSLEHEEDELDIKIRLNRDYFTTSLNSLVVSPSYVPGSEGKKPDTTPVDQDIENEY